VANCTVRELLSHISSHNYSCDAGAVAVAAVLSILLCIVVPFIIIALLLYHLVYKKRHQLDTISGNGGIVGIVSLFCHNLCYGKRNQGDESHIDSRSNRENGENNESSGAEGITYDIINNEPQVTTAPEMKRNQAYARGLTGQT
jgi:hypothetical protein